MMRNKTSFALIAALILSGLSTAPVHADPRGCPPGLAKRGGDCVPPGLSRRGGDRDDWRGHDRRERDDWRRGDRDDRRYDDRRYGDRDDRRYEGRRMGERSDRAYREGYRDGYRLGVGDQMRRGDYRMIDDPRRYGLRPYDRGDDWRYYMIDDMIVRANPDTRQILSIIGLAQALLR